MEFLSPCWGELGCKLSRFIADEGTPVEVPASEGVEVETDDTHGSEIVLMPWDQAVKVARRVIELARARGDLT